MSRIYKINFEFFKEFKEELKNNRSLLILTLFLIIGTAVGAITMGASQNSNNISELFNNYINAKDGQALFSAFLSSFLSFSPYLVISFLLGHTAFGHFIGWFILFFRGLGFGTTIGYLYLNHGVAGMAYCALIFAPPAIVSSLILILSCKRANEMSKHISKMYQKGSRCLSLHSEFSEYCAKHIKYLFIIILNSAFDALLNLVFYKLFDL